MRLEAKYKSQDALARALNERGLDVSRRWVTGVEGGEFEPDLAALSVMGEVLHVPLDYLIRGERSNDSEFVARLRGYEPRLNAPAKRAVLAVAASHAEEESEFDRVKQALLAAGIPRQTIQDAEPRARRILQGSDGGTPQSEAASSVPQSRRAGRVRR